jgi:hypothetical protein
MAVLPARWVVLARVLVLLGLALTLAGAGLLVATYVVGDELQAATLAHTRQDELFVQLPPTPLDPDDEVMVTLTVDADGGSHEAQLEAHSASGAHRAWTHPLSFSKRVGGHHARTRSFTPQDAGPWTFHVTIRPRPGRQLTISHARAVVKQGTFDALLPGVLLVGLGIVLVVGFLDRATRPRLARPRG